MISHAKDAIDAQCPASESRHERYDGVASGPQAVHPSGRPIRNSQTLGDTPPKTATRFRQPGHFCMLAQAWLAVAVGVASKEQPRPPVRGTHVGGADLEGGGTVITFGDELLADLEHPVLRMPDVLKKEGLGPAPEDGADDVSAKVEGVVTSSGCGTKRLTRRSRHDEIDVAIPGSGVEGCKIVPDGCVVEVSVGDTGEDDPLTIGISLDVADGPGER